MGEWGREQGRKQREGAGVGNSGVGGGNQGREESQ